MSRGLELSPADEIARLAAENAKLRKINKVLMDRVERDMDAQGGNAFSLFQTAITLESKVSERTAELRHLTHQLLREISERRAAEQALQAAKAEAEQANLSKTKFLAAASHDLYQPLNAARLFLGALSDEMRDGRARELIGNIDASLETVDELLDALLDISKLDAGVWPVNSEDFEVGPLLRRLQRDYEPQAEAAGLALRVVASAALAHTDRQLLERIIRNLVSNAIRYTERGCVLIGCRRRKDHLRIEVWDTGIGIAEEKREQIFDEFQQLGVGPRRGERGLGLGLAIVRRIARLLKLEIEVRSWPGRGSVFAVRLPYGASVEPPVVAEPLAAPVAPMLMAGHCIIVIENDENTARAMSKILQSWGCMPVPVHSADGALDVLRSSKLRPDLVIADYHLDDGERGTDAIRRIRQLGWPGVPGLVISSNRSQALLAEIGRAKLAFLAKPVAPARLRAMISFLLAPPPGRRSGAGAVGFKVAEGNDGLGAGRYT